MTIQLKLAPRPLADSQLRIRNEVHAFLDRVKDRFAFRQDMNTADVEFSKAFGRAGFLGVTWPKQYGGRELSFLDRYIITEEILAAGAPCFAHWVADRQSGPLILKYGTDGQRQNFLPRIAVGECYFCIGMSEPDSGSDLASVRTTATRADGGWLINGTKLWTSGAHYAHYMIALVRTEAKSDDRHAGLTQMIIDLSSDGVEMSPVYNLAGQHHFNQEIFTDCFVPDDMVIGQPGDGWKQVMSELAYERSGPERWLANFFLMQALADAVGPEPDALQARELGRLTAHLMTLRSMSLSVAGLLSDGELPANEGAMVKDLGTNFCKDLAETARRIVPPGIGGERYAKALREATLVTPSLTIQGGTREILRGMIARGLGLR